LRLDATARYLQDLSDDDTRDVGLGQMTWVVRRTVIDVHHFPTYLEPLAMITWCSAPGRGGPSAADINSPDGARSARRPCGCISIRDPATTAPFAGFEAIFGLSTHGRSVSSRLVLSPPPADLDLSPWPVRFTDFDVMDHVTTRSRS
jgi:acyl-ACP thioesterase